MKNNMGEHIYRGVKTLLRAFNLITNNKTRSLNIFTYIFTSSLSKQTKQLFALKN